MSARTTLIRIGRVVLGTALIGVAVVILLFLTEGAASFLLTARSFYSDSVTFMGPERAHMEYDELLGWRHKPNLALKDLYGPGTDFTTNSQRMRATYDYTRAIPEGKVRIICSGDSFTLGHSVGDAEGWCARLQQLDTRLETVNMGQAAYGVDQAYLWYERDGKALGHSIQLFAFISTDFDRMELDNFGGYPKPVVRAVNGKLVIENVPVPRTMDNVPRQSRVSSALSQLRIVTVLRGLGRRLFSSEAGPVQRGIRQTPEESERAAALIFEELDRLNREKGSQLVLVFLPRPGDESFQWSDERRAFVSREAQRLGIPFIDLIPELRKLPVHDVGKLYVNPFRPSHLNASGNEWVARLLLQRLSELGLIKP